jgi:predicted  nucleic acid-binding Zn-ribbon protein
MTSTTMGSLREVQKLDERLQELRRALETFDEKLAEVEEPALKLEAELSQVSERLAQMRADVRKLERSADDKRSRAGRMDQRLTRVSNLREEAAVQTELDLIRRAIEGDEQEALQLIDQISRTEMAVEELEAAAAEARGEVEPRQRALIDDRQSYLDRVETFRERRAEVLEEIGHAERRVYEAFHQSGRAIVVASLLEDGACGHCFGVIPLQLQNEIRRGEGLIRCEACGVILTAEPEPILSDELSSPLEPPTFGAADEEGPEMDAEGSEGPSDDVAGSEVEETD